MMANLSNIAQSFLRMLPPEVAHEMTLKALEAGLYAHAGDDDPRLRQTVWGREFPNPIGMAAGFDKDARVPGALLNMGFGFTEVGTVTPLPQAGNPRPRLFRLPHERAVINRMGFNGAGHEVVLRRLQNRVQGIIGVNIGMNKASFDPAEDYTLGLQAFAEVADYFVINISSPNTPGLRDLQAPEHLEELLTRLKKVRGRLEGEGEPHRPILVKLAPDLHDDDLKEITDCLIRQQVDGIVLTNTTISRENIPNSRHANESGGLSGRPLFAVSTQILARVSLMTEGKIPLIGVGGIDSGETAVVKIRAGATLLQLYTGLIYRGSGLIGSIKRALLAEMEREGVASLAELCGRDAEKWADAATVLSRR
ncbi:MAG: quinone-dependent dihydroorotate dehydrogenase [Alphaproteobacteria bacterium]